MGKLKIIFWVNIFFIFTTYAKSPLAYSTEVLYKSHRFTGSNLSGQDILFFPLFSKSGFDTTKVVSDKILIKLFSELRPDLNIHNISEFEHEFLLIKKRSQKELDSFYNHLFNANLISLQTSDSVWLSIPWPMVLTIRFLGGSRIVGFDRKIKRQVKMESELWDTRKVKVLWRCVTVGLETDAKRSDSEFLVEGISEILKKLPDYRPVSNETNW